MTTAAFRGLCLAVAACWAAAAIAFIAHGAFQTKFDTEFLKGTLAQACTDIEDKSTLSERVQESCRKHVERLARILGEQVQ